MNIYLNQIAETPEVIAAISNALSGIDADVWHYSMERSRNGGYNHQVDLRIDGHKITLKSHTNDDQIWGEWRDLLNDNYGSEEYEHWVVSYVVDVIERNLDEIYEFFGELANEN